jgi:hypothetical protein
MFYSNIAVRKEFTDLCPNRLQEFFRDRPLHKVILEWMFRFPNRFMVPRIAVFYGVQKIPTLLIGIHEPKGHIGLRSMFRLFQNGLIDSLYICLYLGLVTESPFSGLEG